ncbi:hypothetical protein LMG3410_01553 [Achromobacter aegrifaciens]|uniref:Uncharacterized protein n=1 Tax=Achromobacter mucicolens TaxID=1389922 RepID=A0ABM8LL18_9BURK|nr:hypothetical protein LMG3410_01553 [Achromobacter aegrifaciens]CAB3913368.1 hypothetical protein LMG3415_05095 [Achromobacter mucicolens]
MEPPNGIAHRGLSHTEFPCYVQALGTEQNNPPDRVPNCQGIKAGDVGQSGELIRGQGAWDFGGHVEGRGKGRRRHSS